MPVFAPGTSILTPMPLTVHRFEQTIGSQHYVVEVRRVRLFFVEEFSPYS